MLARPPWSQATISPITAKKMRSTRSEPPTLSPIAARNDASSHLSIKSSAKWVLSGKTGSIGLGQQTFKFLLSEAYIWEQTDHAKGIPNTQRISSMSSFEKLTPQFKIRCKYKSVALQILLRLTSKLSLLQPEYIPSHRIFDSQPGNSQLYQRLQYHCSSAMMVSVWLSMQQVGVLRMMPSSMRQVLNMEYSPRLQQSMRQSWQGPNVKLACLMSALLMLTTQLLLITVPPAFLLSVLLVRQTNKKFLSTNSQAFKITVSILVTWGQTEIGHWNLQDLKSPFPSTIAQVLNQNESSCLGLYQHIIEQLLAFLVMCSQVHSVSFASQTAIVLVTFLSFTSAIFK